MTTEQEAKQEAFERLSEKQTSPKEIALKTLDCGGHTCNNFKAVDKAIDIAIKKTKEQIFDILEKWHKNDTINGKILDWNDIKQKIGEMKHEKH